MALPEVGVQVVAKGAETAQKQLSAFNRSVASTQSAVQKAASRTGIGQLDSAASGASKSIGGLGGAFGGLTGKLAVASVAFMGITHAMQVSAGVIKQVYGLLNDLGRQASRITSISRAFGNIFAGVGEGGDILAKLRQQVHGTISDVELMRLAVAGLQNTDAEFKKIVGTQFGQIIDSTRRIAEATGENADIIQEKFIRGLRLSRKLLVDDVGAIFELKDAYESYAKTLGKSAAALTEQEKRAAFATEAIKQLKNAADELGERNTLADSFGQISASFQNIKDIFASAVKPSLTAFFSILAQVASRLQAVFRDVAPILREISMIISNFVLAAFDNLQQALGSLQPYWDALRMSLPYIAAAIRLIGQAFLEVFNTISRLVIPIFAKLFPQIDAMTQTQFDKLAYNFARGAGRIIGAFAKGIALGAKYVIQAVTFIAQIVADFLEGFSPPKKGPLHDIDKGATRVAEAWADGFAMMDLEPVDNVLAQVNQRLGDIGNFTREQVTSRLEALDLAIRPFVEQLDIVKSDFEAIAGFADPALKAIDRQRSRLLQLAGKGSFIDIERLRALDRQSDMLSELRDTSQDSVDNAEIQLALASAQQAQERALLNIQQRRLGEAEKATAGSGSTPERPTTGGGGEAPTSETSAGLPIGGLAPDLIDTSAVDAALANLESGFNKGLAESGAIEAIAGATGQLGLLQGQLNRIKRANPVDKLTEKFAGLKEKISKPFKDAQIAIDAVMTGLEAGFGALGLALDALGSKFTAIGNTIATIFDPIIRLSNLIGLTLPLSFGLFKAAFSLNVYDTIMTFVNLLTGTFFPKLDTFINYMYALLPADFVTFFNSLTTNITDPLTAFSTFLTDTLWPAFNKISEFVSQTFSPVLKSLKTNAIDPLKGAFDSFKGAIDLVAGALDGVINSLSGLPNGLVNIVIDNLGNVPGLATGALGMRGPAIVGERGPELIVPTSASQKYNVFPASATAALQSISSNIASAANYGPSQAAYYSYSGNDSSSTSIDNSRNNSGNVTIQVNSPEEALWMRRQLLAKYGVN
jgi:phage-related protein